MKGVVFLLKYKSEIIAAIIGGSGFILTYLIGNRFFISLTAACCLTIVIYLILLLQPKKTPDISLTMDALTKEEYELFLVDFRKCYKELGTEISLQGNSIVRGELESIYEILWKIEEKVKTDKQSYKQVKEFTDRYLPSFLQMVKRYTTLDSAKIESENSLEFKENFSCFMKEMRLVFQRKLEYLYDDSILDSELDMEVMKMTLRMEGLMNDDAMKPQN